MKSSSSAPPSAAHADYISRDGQYALRSGVELVESGNMPEFAQVEPRLFWVAADTHERANGRTYTELQIALPRELSDSQRVELARQAAREFMGDRFAFTLAVHNPLAKDKIEQPHMHLMFSERVIDETTRSMPEDRFFKRNGAKKDRATWHDREKPEEIRVKWCEMMNRAMEREGIDVRVDPRSWAEQGREDLVALIEEKELRGDGPEAVARRKEITHLRELRQELPAMQMNGAVDVQMLEMEAAAQIAEIEKKLEQELSILDQMIAAVRKAIEGAKAAIEWGADQLQNLLVGADQFAPKADVEVAKQEDAAPGADMVSVTTKQEDPSREDRDRRHREITQYLEERDLSARAYLEPPLEVSKEPIPELDDKELVRWIGNYSMRHVIDWQDSDQQYIQKLAALEKEQNYQYALQRKIQNQPVQPLWRRAVLEDPLMEEKHLLDQLKAQERQRCEQIDQYRLIVARYEKGRDAARKAYHGEQKAREERLRKEIEPILRRLSKEQTRQLIAAEYAHNSEVREAAEVRMEAGEGVAVLDGRALLVELEDGGLAVIVRRNDKQDLEGQLPELMQRQRRQSEPDREIEIQGKHKTIEREEIERE